MLDHLHFYLNDTLQWIFSSPFKVGDEKELQRAMIKVKHIAAPFFLKSTSNNFIAMITHRLINSQC